MMLEVLIRPMAPLVQKHCVRPTILSCCEWSNRCFRVGRGSVSTADLGTVLNLPIVAITLGLDRPEYEPEQHPALIYRLDLMAAR
jgi:hypothetical protein